MGENCLVFSFFFFAFSYRNVLKGRYFLDDTDICTDYAKNNHILFLYPEIFIIMLSSLKIQTM